MRQLQSSVMLELHIPSFNEAKKFYGSIGFEIVWEKAGYGESLDYMVMRNEDRIINFYGNSDKVYNHSHFSKFDKISPRGYGVEIIIPVEGINKFYEDYKTNHGSSIVKTLNNEHSHKDFRVVDPFGFYIRFVERYNWVDGRDKNGKVLDMEANETL